jgi:hypothetical protein
MLVKKTKDQTQKKHETAPDAKTPREFKKKKINSKIEHTESEATSEEKQNKHVRKTGRHFKKAENNIDKKLIEIYENDDGTMPDMTMFVAKKNSRLAPALITLIISLTALAAVAWAGFFIFQPKSSFAEENVILSVSGDEEAESGQEVQYRIRYRNAQMVSLTNTKLQVRYPAGFIFEKASIEPSNEAKDEWNIGTVNKDAGGMIDIYGRFYADFDEKQSIRAFLNYYPENFNSEFQKVATTNIKISGSPIELAIDAPQEISTGNVFSFNVSARKNKDLPESVKKIFVSIEPSGVFTKKTSSKESVKNENLLWEVSDYENNEYKLNIVGSFDAQEGENPSLLVQVFGESDNQKINRFILCSEKKDFKLIKSNVSVALIANGSNGDFSMPPGEKLNASIVVKNDGEQPLENVSVRFLIDAPSADKKSIFNWAELNDPGDGVIVGEQLGDNVRRGIITWNKSLISGLKTIEPGKSVPIDIQIPLKNVNQTDLTAFAESKAVILADAQYDIEDGKKTVASSPINIKILSDFDFEVRTSSKAAGAGKEYAVTWILTNSFHDLKDVSVSTDFFGDIAFDEDTILKPPAGSVAIDKEKNRITWNVSEMPVSVDVLAYVFKVKLNKINTSQTNLTSVIKAEAFDSLSQEKIVKAKDAILIQ